jgi:hypothetical protein
MIMIVVQMLALKLQMLWVMFFLQNTCEFGEKRLSGCRLLKKATWIDDSQDVIVFSFPRLHLSIQRLRYSTRQISTIYCASFLTHVRSITFFIMNLIISLKILIKNCTYIKY